MQVAVNPTIIIAKELEKTQRKVDSVASLFDVDSSVGDNVFISDRNAEVKLIKDYRGKYYRCFGHATAHQNSIRLSMVPTVSFSVGSTFEMLARVPDFASLPTAGYSTHLGGKAFGFRTVSSKIEFELHSSARSSLEIESITDEFGNVYPLAAAHTVSDLPRDKWLRVKLRCYANAFDLTTSALKMGVWYNTASTEALDYQEVKLSIAGGETYEWKFESGLTNNGKTLTLTGDLANQFFDVDLQGNNIDLLEQASPYKLYSVVPQNGRVTPQNLGAKRFLNPNNTSDAADSTAIIQAALNKGLPLRIDGFYYVKGRDKLPEELFRVGFDITRETHIELDGNSTGLNLESPKGISYKYGVAVSSGSAVPSPEIEDIGDFLTTTSVGIKATWYVNGNPWQIQWTGTNYEIMEQEGVSAATFSGPTTAGNPIGVYSAVANATGSVVVRSNLVELEQEFEGLGCLYTGADPVDLFRIFSEDFHFRGGLVYVGNTKYTLAENANLTDYHTLSPYYVPPKVFNFYWYFNTMTGSSIDTAIKGKYTEVQKYNGGHIGVFWDNSRLVKGDPITRPAGFGEFHKGYCKLNARDLYAPFFLTPEEPFQDFGDRLNSIEYFASNPSDDSYNDGPIALGGFKAENPVDLGGASPSYAVDSPADYTVAVGKSKRFSIRWGNSGIRNVIVSWSNTTTGTFWQKLDNALIDAKFPDGVIFRAVAHPTGSNQSFRIVSNQAAYSVRVYINSTAAWHEFDCFSWNCKTIRFQTPNTSYLKCHFQPAATLADSGVVAGLDENYSEKEFPCVTITGGNTLDALTVDLNGGTGFNKRSFELQGAVYLVGESNRARTYGSPSIFWDNPASDLRNYKWFLHVRPSSGSANGFIGSLDNVFYYLHKRATVTINTYTHDGSFNFDTAANAVGRATLDNSAATISSGESGTGEGVFENLFTDELLGMYILYNESFDEELSFVEFEVSGWAGFTQGIPVIYNHYLEWAKDFVPREIHIMQIAPGNIAYTRKIDTAFMSKEWYWTEGAINTTGNDKILLRLIGCKNKARRFWFKTWQAVGRNNRNDYKPYLSIGGGAEILGTTKFSSLRIADAGGTYHDVVPQAEGSIPDLATLVARLKSAGVIY